MPSSIPGLDPAAASHVSTGWRLNGGALDLSAYRRDADREEGLPEVEAESARRIVAEAMDLFTLEERAKSDAWLAPRLHSVLRLSRREAARRPFWLYVSLVVCPDYVRWRWAPIKSGEPVPGEPAAADRFHGDPTKHALARLWWGAELFRDGPNYTPVVKAYGNQDLMNNLFRMDIAHHRPTVQAAVTVLFPEGGKPLGGDAANALAKAANAAASTLLVDAIAPDEPLDASSREAWMKDAVDALRIVDRMPEGPDDPRVPTHSIDKMTELMDELLRAAKRRDRSAGPSDATDAA
ncbi:DUF6339 family protein [Kineococcus terrestris]|uniref:DUF6339 family protein n=1 Tax=Kineococcus terrestris TaxID=2044856 RepID=UPI0034DB1CD0